MFYLKHKCQADSVFPIPLSPHFLLLLCMIWNWDFSITMWLSVSSLRISCVSKPTLYMTTYIIVSMMYAQNIHTKQSEKQRTLATVKINVKYKKKLNRENLATPSIGIGLFVSYILYGTLLSSKWPFSCGSLYKTPPYRSYNPPSPSSIIVYTFIFIILFFVTHLGLRDQVGLNGEVINSTNTLGEYCSHVLVFWLGLHYTDKDIKV